MSSSSLSRHAKNESDDSNRSSFKSIEITNYSKVKKKKTTNKKQKYKEIYQPPLHFDFNVVSSSSRPKEVLSISGDSASTQKPKSVYNSSVTSKRNDSMSVASNRSHSYQDKTNINNTNPNIVNLPPPSKPNFIRKSQETIVNANFDDRWQLYLEMKALDDARNRIYFKVYFYKWKMLSSTRFIQRIREKTANFGNFQTNENINHTNLNDKNTNDDANYLINKARKKYNEYTSFLSEFEGQVSNFLQIPTQSVSDNANKIKDNISKIQSISKSNITESKTINNNQNIINNYNRNNNINSTLSNSKNSFQQQDINNNKAYIFNKNENEEDNSSAFFNEFDNNSILVENRLISEANRNTMNSKRGTAFKDQQSSQLCEFDFTDSSDNLLQIETPPPSNPNSFMEPRPPSENSESGEIPRSEVQISTDSITVANSFCDMVDNSIIKSKELAVKTKMVLADESQSSSDVENEIKDHSFIHEKKRRYISSSSSEEEDEFLPRIMIRYSKNHNSSSSLADSFHVSSFDSQLDGNNKYFSRGFPSDLYDEILGPLPVTKIKMAKK